MVALLCHTMLCALSYEIHLFRLEICAKATVGVPFELALVHYLSIQRVGDPRVTRAGSVHTNVVPGYHRIHPI